MKANQSTVWEAFNEPVVEITEEQARNLVMASLVIVLGAWLAPYWGATETMAYATAGEPTIFEQMAMVETRGGIVAGASTGETYGSAEAVVTAPDWYYMISAVPTVLAESVADSAEDILDISQPVGELVEFYEPGVSAVWNEWLNLMRDPGTPSF